MSVKHNNDNKKIIENGQCINIKLYPTFYRFDDMSNVENSVFYNELPISVKRDIISYFKSHDFAIDQLKYATEMITHNFGPIDGRTSFDLILPPDSITFEFPQHPPYIIVNIKGRLMQTKTSETKKRINFLNISAIIPNTYQKNDIPVTRQDVINLIYEGFWKSSYEGTIPTWGKQFGKTLGGGKNGLYSISITDTIVSFDC